MKGVILAGGLGTRLFPLTKGVNKHLLPIGNKPMISYPLEKLKNFGIEDVLIVTAPKDLTAFAQTLGDGSELGIDLHFRVQQHPGGIAQALHLAQSFVGNEPFFLLLGDNLFDEPLKSLSPHFPLKADEAFVVLKEVKNPEQFGIALMKDKKIIDVVEKPKTLIGNLCVTGIYAYTPKVFDVIRELKPSGRGELEISDVNRFYAQAGKLKYHILAGRWIDAGTLESYQDAHLAFSNPPSGLVAAEEAEAEEKNIYPFW